MEEPYIHSLWVDILKYSDILKSKPFNNLRDKHKKHMWTQRHTLTNTLQNKAEQWVCNGLCCINIGDVLKSLVTVGMTTESQKEVNMESNTYV